VQACPVPVGQRRVVGVRDFLYSQSEELFLRVPEHLAALLVDVNETSVFGNVSDTDGRKLDRARVAFLALAEFGHRNGTLVKVADLHSE
jgi:hypothetical protein